MNNVELSDDQLGLLDTALATVIDSLTTRAYHHTVYQDSTHHQNDAKNCWAAADRYQALREYLQKVS